LRADDVLHRGAAEGRRGSGQACCPSPAGCLAVARVRAAARPAGYWRGAAGASRAPAPRTGTGAADGDGLRRPGGGDGQAALPCLAAEQFARPVRPVCAVALAARARSNSLTMCALGWPPLRPGLSLEGERRCGSPVSQDFGRGAPRAACRCPCLPAAAPRHPPSPICGWRSTGRPPLSRPRRTPWPRLGSVWRWTPPWLVASCGCDNAAWRRRPGPCGLGRLRWLRLGQTCGPLCAPKGCWRPAPPPPSRRRRKRCAPPRCERRPWLAACCPPGAAGAPAATAPRRRCSPAAGGPAGAAASRPRARWLRQRVWGGLAAARGRRGGGGGHAGAPWQGWPGPLWGRARPRPLPRQEPPGAPAGPHLAVRPPGRAGGLGRRGRGRTLYGGQPGDDLRGGGPL
jgi:hypothetical protein